MASSEATATSPESVRRKALFATVSALCCEVGFVSADKPVLETLTEMLQSFLTELGKTTRLYCELSCRTEPVLGDVVMALIDLGINVESIPIYAKRTNKLTLNPSPLIHTPQQTKALQAGIRKPHPSYIPEHLPPFPDPHTYIKTATHKQPVTEYKAIREKAATQKRDIERALTRFIAKVGETHCLFKDDISAYPLIACKFMHHPYLEALLPKDQVFENEEELIIIQKRRRAVGSDLTGDGKTEELSQESQEADDMDTNGNINDLDYIDNPYLRPVKMPKKRKLKF